MGGLLLVHLLALHLQVLRPVHSLDQPQGSRECMHWPSLTHAAHQATVKLPPHHTLPFFSIHTRAPQLLFVPCLALGMQFLFEVLIVSLLLHSSLSLTLHQQVPLHLSLERLALFLR